MPLIETLLFAALLIPIYLLSAAATARLERLAERPLGAWRSAVFFLLFFAQLLAAMQLMALLIGDAGRGNAT